MSTNTTSLLKNLPCRNKRNFTIARESDKVKALEPMSGHKIAWHVPQRPDERIVKNDRFPLLLKYLEKNFGLKNTAEARSSKSAATSSSTGSTTKASKRKEASDDLETSIAKTKRLNVDF
ncbi:unnamed protein product, partial [Mesorhabditis belari]|uniref:DET1- and DDB1-associated protein 1 n=1 Tax=Mesorhabditis belari TaxID=2138241 RepID=A0AAF3FAD5_9BILA